MIAVTNHRTWFASCVAHGDLAAASRLVDLGGVKEPAGIPSEAELFALLAPTGAELARLARWLDSLQPEAFRILVAFGSGVPPDLDAMLSSLADAGYGVAQVSSHRLVGLCAVELAVRRRPEARGASLAIRLQLASLTREWRRRLPSVGARVGVMAGTAQRAAEGFADVHVFGPDVAVRADVQERYGPTVLVHERDRPPSGVSRWEDGRYLPAPDDLSWLLTPAELGAWSPDGLVRRFVPEQLAAAGGSAGHEVVGRFVAACVRTGSAPALAGEPGEVKLAHDLDREVKHLIERLEGDDAVRIERRSMAAWRLAVRRYSTAGWWTRCLGSSPTPSVSVVVEVADEAELGHVRREIGAQRDIERETVVIWSGGSSAPTSLDANETIVEHPSARSSLLWAARHIARGELVVTWSSGWYARDHIMDLADMWRFSGHTLVARRGQFHFVQATEPWTVHLPDAGPDSLAAAISRQDLLELDPSDDQKLELTDQVRLAGGTAAALPGVGFVRRSGSDLRLPDERRGSGRSRYKGLNLPWAGIS